MSKKICIIGNSVSMIMTPDRTNANEKTYAEWLERLGVVINASKQAVMLEDVYRYLEDEVVRYFPDYIIINMGIVEATYRARPRFLQNYFSENAWNNNIINIGYVSVFGRGIRRIAKFSYRYLEKLLYLFGAKWRWMGPRAFRHSLLDILRRLSKHTPVKKIFVFGMLPIKPGFEKIAPGTAKSVTQYNSIIREVVQQIDKANYVDMEQVFANKIDMASTDSIHFTALGHEKIAEHIITAIQKAEDENSC